MSEAADAPMTTNWDRPCPTCGAQPGQPCRRPNTDRLTTYTGAPRFHVARQSRRAAGRDA